jgi:alkaline phosphatase
MTYVDGFVLSVKQENRAKYKKLAKEAAETWKKFGALDYKECRLDDVNPPWVTFTFPEMAKSKKDEETWFAFIVFESKAERNRINKAVMKFFEQKYQEKDYKDMPFDMKRMSYGGFKTEVEM